MTGQHSQPLQPIGNTKGQTLYALSSCVHKPLLWLSGDQTCRPRSPCKCDASEMVAWAPVMKKISGHSPAKDAPQPACVGEISPNKDQDATCAPAFVKSWRKRFLGPAGYGGRPKADHDMSSDTAMMYITARVTLTWSSDLALSLALHIHLVNPMGHIEAWESITATRWATPKHESPSAQVKEATPKHGVRSTQLKGTTTKRGSP